MITINKIFKLKNHLKYCNTIQLIGIATTLIISISIIFVAISKSLRIPISNYSAITTIENINPLKSYLIIGILGPLLETLIFQKWTINSILFLTRKTKFNPTKFTILSAGIIFGISHPYNMLYFIYASFIGVIFAFFYIILKKRKENEFLIIFVIHACVNSIFFLPLIIDKWHLFQ